MKRRPLLQSATAALAASITWPGLVHAEGDVADSAGDPKKSGPLATSFKLTSPATQAAAPFQIGLGLKKGDARNIVCDLLDYQVSVKRRWLDGSLKHAIVSGHAPLTANTPLTVRVSAGTPPTSAALTSANILAAAPTASVRLGSFGTVNLSSLLATPFRTWISGPKMVECHYQANVGTLLSVWFHVRLYSSGKVRVRIIVNNGYLDNGSGGVAANASLVYVPIVVIGGVTVFTRPDVAITNVAREILASDRAYHRAIFTAPGYQYQVGMTFYVSGVGGSTQVNNREFSVGSMPDSNTIVTPYSYQAEHPYDTYTSGGVLQFTHTKNTSWVVDGWVGTDPQVSVLPDVAYLNTTRLIPNYGLGGMPTDRTLNAQPSSYVPMQQGGWSTVMGATGFQPQIGLLPNWDALYCKSGDARAFKSMQVNSRCLRSYRIGWLDKKRKTPVKPSDFPTWTYAGPGQGGTEALPSGALTWESAHHGSAGYLAYLLTGDYDQYEIMALQSAANYLITSSARGAGLHRFLQGQLRGTAWAFRTIGQYAAIATSDDVIADEYRTLLKNNYDIVNSYCTKAGASPIGLPFVFGTYSPSKPLATAPWMNHFFIATNGYLWDIEPGYSDKASHQNVRDFMYRAVVGILGGNGKDNFCFTRASTYTYTVSSEIIPNYAITDATHLYTTWGQVWTATFDTENNSCGNTLQGTSGSDPRGASGGFWGNLLPAIAYAVDHNAKGADVSWARLTDASNWSALVNSGFNNTATWGVVPRRAKLPFPST